MTKRKTTRRALLSSVLALVLCFTMLLGTTYAWFTDSVTSANNIIKSGTLEIAMDWAKGNEDPAASTTVWTDASEGAIFNNKLWEPGYTEARHIRIKNTGTLALKYSLAIIPTGEVSALADVIDVYYIEGGRQVADRAALSELTPKGTLADLINSGIKSNYLLEGTSDTITIVLKMRESAGNEYQNLSIGDDFAIQLFATQYTYEEDSFDKYYDEDTAVFDLETAQERILAGEDVTLVNLIKPTATLYVPADYAGTLVLQNVTLGAIVEGNPPATTTVSLTSEETAEPTAAEIVVFGDVAIKATGAGQAAISITKLNLVVNGKLTATAKSGSAITGEYINISGKGKVTAIANGEEAFGIGGMNTAEINITGVNIEKVVGGEAYGVGEDTKYYKDAPEGGAAIGSGKNGATITLSKVTVTKAIGGSKAAAIGARYHTGVVINITDSVIDYAEGGVSAAAIGGSRVSNGATENGTSINITNSTVTAKGGAYGAGIGSGYDTHCQSSQPMCAINISDSTIDAIGGKYAAGVGSGYHNAALSGEIKNSTVNAVSGDKFYKDTYTTAQDIGFGVVDPAREGQQTDSKLIYNGTEIGIPEVITITAWENIDVVNADTTVKNMVAEEYVEICHKGGNLTIENVSFENGLTLYTEQSSTGTITLKNCKIYLSDGIPANTSYNMCNADYGLYLGAISPNVIYKFENCTFTAHDNHSYTNNNKGYNVYIGGNYSADSITFEGCTFEKSSKHGIGCSFGYIPNYKNNIATYYNLTVKGCNFVDWNNGNYGGAAIRGNVPADVLTNYNKTITIEGNTFGNSNGSGNDNVAIDSWAGTWS